MKFENLQAIWDTQNDKPVFAMKDARLLVALYQQREQSRRRIFRQLFAPQCLGTQRLDQEAGRDAMKRQAVIEGLGQGGQLREMRGIEIRINQSHAVGGSAGSKGEECLDWNEPVRTAGEGGDGLRR